MNPQAPNHQRIRFRRNEIVDLNALPSAVGQGAARLPAGRSRFESGLGGRLLRWAGAALGLAIALALLFVLAVYLVSVTGIGKERLRAAAESVLERAVGRDMATAIGETRISVDGASLLGLEISEVELQAAGQPRRFARFASLRFGIEMMPLLTGRLVLSGVSVSGASLDAGALGSSRGGDWLAGLRREDGLLDPDRVPPAVFGVLRQTFAALDDGFSGKIELSDIAVSLPVGGSEHDLRVTAAEAELSASDALSLLAEGTLDGRAWSLSGVAEREVSSGRITLLDIDFSAPRSGTAAAIPETGNRLGSLHAELTGEQGAGGAPSRILLHTRAEDSAVDLTRNRGVLAGTAEVALQVAEGAGGIRIDRLRLGDGRSAFELEGTVTPRAGSAEAEPAYALDLNGSNLVLAADPLEPPFAFDARLGGSFEPVSRRLRAESVSLASGGAAVTGSLGLHLAEGMSSGIDVALAASALPVSGAKQLWPRFAARGVRSWVGDHLTGGTVEEGRIDYHMAPGRIGSGTPPAPDELSGTMTLTGTRFDTSGEIPPVSDADGIVSFRGTDADIAVSTGRMTLPSGRTLVSDGGSLTLRAVNRPPLIGRLEVGIEGDAAAMAELAALKPIDATKQLPFDADDLSGGAKGHVSADVPFSRGVPRERLDYAVSLDFSGLAVAEPFEGQTLRDAAGTLSADPVKLVFQADAKLNGAPAKLAFTEPLRPDGPQRSRKIELELDDKARDALAPGLSAVLSGPVEIAVDAGKPDKQVRADLSRAKLSAPWVGWSKGAGVPATATFTMTRAEGGIAISDLELSGETFRLLGSVKLDGGGLASAQLPSVQLNREDRVAVTVRRAGKAFEVSVDGDSYDARALVKAATARSEGDGAAKRGGSQTPTEIALKARLGSVSGFGGESLKGVSVALRTGGGRSRSLEISAATDGGGAVSISDAVRNGERRMALRTADAGSLLRFLNLYGNMRGGGLDAALAGPADGLLKGAFDARNFSLFNEPRLASLVSSRPNGGSRSLQDAVRRNIDTGRVVFDRASADLERGPRTLAIENGVLRGSTIGSTFQGTVYDEKGRMDMTGTFMPAYGLNRLFGELPLVGLILGNGNDRGLIGVTFKLEGDAQSPTVTVNPLSAIAPGIFRQIFEYD